MKTSTAIAVVLALIIVVGGVYWWMQSGGSFQMPTQTATSTTPGTAYVPNNLLLGTDASATLGTYLIASNGMTLYKYANDKSGTSTCSGACATAWPPYTIGNVSALANIQAGVKGQVGTIVRADGNTQVTYNGLPLYFYKGDAASGDTTGQGVGGVWSVVKP